MLQQTCIKALELLVSNVAFGIAILSMQESFLKRQGTSCLKHAERNLCAASGQLVTEYFSQ